MAADVRRYERMKREVEEAQSEADRAVGAREQALRTLNEEFKCETLEEARTLRDKLKTQLQAAETDYDAILDEFENEFADRLRAIQTGNGRAGGPEGGGGEPGRGRK